MDWAYWPKRGLHTVCFPCALFTWPKLTLRSNRGIGSQTKTALKTIFLLLKTRLVRSWNQTGQKFAGEPDTVKTFLLPNPYLLWYLVGATYFWLHSQLVSGFDALPLPVSYSGVSGLLLAAAAFKLAFTYEDAPELVTGLLRHVLELEFMQGYSLVSRARAFFFGLGLAIACTLFYVITRRRLSVKVPGE